MRGPEFGRCYVPPEAALSLDLDHPNIISTYKIVVEDSAPTAEGSGVGSCSGTSDLGTPLSFFRTGQASLIAETASRKEEFVLKALKLSDGWIYT